MKHLILTIFFLLCGFPARADSWVPPLKLEWLNFESDVVFKGVVLETAPVEDASFGKIQGFASVQTRFRVVSVLQGQLVESEIAFHHYTIVPRWPSSSLGPHHYIFQKGRAYLIWADKSGAHLRQIRDTYTMRSDQGALLCADHNPRGRAVKKAMWSELYDLLKSESPADVAYSIAQLDAMSRPTWIGADDFKRAQVLPLIVPFLASHHQNIALTVILAIGHRNEAAQFQTQLIDIVLHSSADNVRIKAMQALDKIKTPEIRAVALQILGYQGAPIEGNARLRYWALRHLALFPGTATRRAWHDFSKSASSLEREGVAQSIGRAKDAAMLPILDALLDDASEDVRRVAASELLDFPAPVAKEWWKKRRRDSYYYPLFTIALAKPNPQYYRVELTQILVKKPRAALNNFILYNSEPLHVAWDVLYDYAQKQPTAAFQNASLDAILNALELYDGYSRHSLEILYRLLREKGLEKRAAAFRMAHQTSVGHDMSTYFDSVDRQIKAKNARP